MTDRYFIYIIKTLYISSCTMLIFPWYYVLSRLFYSQLNFFMVFILAIIIPTTIINIISFKTVFK